MSGDLKPGWCEVAGREAGERERGERFAPVSLLPGQTKRHYIPVLPQPKPEQIESVKRAGRASAQRKLVERKLDAVLGKVD